MCLLSWRGGSDVLTAGGTEIEWLRLREAGAKNCDAYGVDGGVDGRGDSERGLPLGRGRSRPGQGRGSIEVLDQRQVARGARL